MDQSVTTIKQIDSRYIARDSGLVALRFALLMAMLVFSLLVGFIAYGDRRAPTANKPSSSSGALILDMVSGTLLKDGVSLDGSYKSPKAVSIHYVVVGADTGILSSGKMALDRKSRFSGKILIDKSRTIEGDAMLQVYAKDQNGGLLETISLPVVVQSIHSI